MSFITLDQYPLDLIPFDNDLLSLEMGSSFKVLVKKKFLGLAVSGLLLQILINKLRVFDSTKSITMWHVQLLFT